MKKKAIPRVEIQAESATLRMEKWKGTEKKNDTRKRKKRVKEPPVSQSKG